MKRLYTINGVSKTLNLLYKAIILIFGVAGVIIGIISEGNYLYFVFFSNTTFMIFAAYSVLNFAHQLLEPAPDSLLTKLLYISHGIAFPSELFLSAFYWVMLASDDFKDMKRRCWSPELCQIVSIMYHVFASIFALVPIFSEYLAAPWFNIVYCYIYGFGYAIFVLVPITLTREKELYDGITFRNFYSYFIITLGMLSVGLFYGIGKWLNRLIVGEFEKVGGGEGSGRAYDELEG